MIDILVERNFAPRITLEEVLETARDAGGCFGLYRIDWVESLLATDGSAMICRFQAPDLESVRKAFHQTTGEIPVLWPGTEHRTAATLSPNPPALGDILVSRRFEQPVSLDDIQALEDAGAWCLESRHVHFVRSLFSRDQTRMICLYRAPDAEAVRSAQRQAGVPFETVWAYQHLTPGDARC